MLLKIESSSEKSTKKLGMRVPCKDDCPFSENKRKAIKETLFLEKLSSKNAISSIHDSPVQSKPDPLEGYKK